MKVDPFDDSKEETKKFDVVPDWLEPYDDSKEETKNFDVISGWLDLLSHTCKKLITEFYMNKSSWKIIAENENYSNAKSARNQKSKCMEVLKAKVKGKGFNL